MVSETSAGLENRNDSSEYDEHRVSEVAVVGLAGRFPGARDLDEFWRNLRDGVDSISFFTDEELRASGVAPEAFNAPGYVRAKAVLDNAEMFDAAFFDYNPREAEMLDPQLRLMLECAVEAFEHAGYDSEKFKGRIGVYAGASAGSYLTENLASHQDLIERVGAYQVDIGNHGEFVPTSISFKLNLKGPSINIQTACSTSLVAVHVACQSLLNGECDMALAGGCSVTFPRKAGYFYQEAGILSPDGRCRAFDERAQGTVGGEGVGLVVLKRLTDALRDGDCVHAVIRGSAVNNDGALKVGYTAPSVDGQAEVIAEALALAGVGADSITYVEAHGTGTSLGDPVEITALTQAFRAGARAKGFCAVGSLKTNLGHLDAAAGVAGLIKTVLALSHRQIPPSLHYERPNPKIDFQNSPFYVNARLADWPTNGTPRRAGVSSFGIGGTNAHLVLEEAPAPGSRGPSRTHQLLALSAKTATALDALTKNLGEHLKQHPEPPLPDVAYTLHVGRRAFGHRRVLVCRDTREAADALATPGDARLLTSIHEPRHRPVAFMFPGQGAQYAGMGRGLYEGEPAFREEVDACAELLAARLGFDLRDVLFPREEDAAAAEARLRQTSVTQPALFAVEYALAKLWMSWGVRPSAMIGHSIGEYVAACLAGVMSLQDALTLVAERGRLMQRMPPGSMLAAMLSEGELAPLLRPGLSLAAVNAGASCVVSGTPEAIAALQEQLAARGVGSQPLHTSHAFHSGMMEPILEEFTELVRGVELSAPRLRFASNVTGLWITDAEATDPRYWATHLRQTVRFADGLGALLKEAEVLLEVGPGQTLSTLVRQHPARGARHAVVNSLRHPREQRSDEEFLLNAVGRLWLEGVTPEWEQFYAHEQRRRIPLPTYPFERRRYYLEPRGEDPGAAAARVASGRKRDLADWFYLPSWRRTPPVARRAPTHDPGCRLVFADELGFAPELARRLKERGARVVLVSVGERFGREGDEVYCVNPRRKEDYEALFRDLSERGLRPSQVVHLWGVGPSGATADEAFERAQERALYSLIFLTQAWAKEPGTPPLQLCVVTDGAQEVDGGEELRPEKATALGACKVIPQEHPNVSCRTIDVEATAAEGDARALLVSQLLDEIEAEATEPVVAYRGRYRWAQSFEPLRSDESAAQSARLREGGVYLLTGGLGGVGLALADYLARTYRAKLVLVGRGGLPDREEWPRLLADGSRDDELHRRIEKVLSLEGQGAEVLVVRADVTDEAQMREALARAEERFGRLHGVIHGAAVGEGADKELADTTPADCARHFGPKARALAVLEKLLAGKELDFCLLLSSLSSVLGGLTYTAYAAANAYMDAFAHRHNRARAAGWLSVNWDAWDTDADDERETHAPGPAATEHYITPREGGEAFGRLLSAEGVTQIVVSTTDLQARLARWLTRASRVEEEPERQAEAEAAAHPRPNLGVAYAAPGNELEQEIADIWQELLGIERVGVNDNFFELGGHSLLATMIVSRLRKDFGVELPLRSLFESPTVAGLAAAVAQCVLEQQDQESLAELLGELEGAP